MTALLSNLLDSWGLTPPSRLRRFVFDVVAFHDELTRTHSKHWTFVMNADASILSTKQNMSFTYAVSRSDPTHLVQADISGVDDYEYDEALYFDVVHHSDSASGAFLPSKWL